MDDDELDTELVDDGDDWLDVELVDDRLDVDDKLDVLIDDELLVLLAD